MKKFYLLTLFLLTCIALAKSQDIVYTISATKDGSTAYLDSILFENLDNETRFMVGDLPDLPSYEINLTSQSLVTRAEHIDFSPKEAFNLIKNVPGEASIQLVGKSFENTTLNIFTVSGHKVFTQVIPTLSRNDIITVSLPISGVYILNFNTSSGAFNYRVMGSAADLHGYSRVSISTAHNRLQTDNDVKIKTYLKSSPYNTAFSFQPGDSIRVTAFLGGYYTYPHGNRITDSKSINFTMLLSTAESTGVSDRYKPVESEEYTILEYDPETGKTSFILLSDTIEYLPGDILTIDLDTIGLIQKVVNVKEVDGDIIVETEPGYMDELFVNAEFKLDTRMIEPTKSLKSTSTPEEIIEALTDEDGYIHPVKIIYHDSQERKVLKSVFSDDFSEEHRVNIIDFYEDFSGTDLYGKKGDNIHFYIDEGYASLTADAVFEFSFKYDGELTEDTKVKRSDLEFFKFYLDADAGFQTKLALDMNRSRERQSRDRIFRMGRATAKFVVPPAIPVWITFSCDIYSDYHFKADASLNATWGFESNHSLQAGGMFERTTNEFSPIWDYKPENTIYPLDIEGEVNAYARLELYPRTDIRLYGFFGPFAEIVPFVEGNYNAALQSQITLEGHETFLAWNSGIDLGLDLRLGTSLRFLGGLRNIDFGPNVINVFNWPLWASPVDIELLTQLPEQIEPGETIELQVKVTDYVGLPVPLCPVYFDGDGVFSKQLPITNTSGIVTINWTPGNSAGKNEFTSTIFKADKGVINYISGSTTVSDVVTYTLVLSVSPSGSGEVTGSGSYHEGEDVGISATANEGYQFVNWTGDINNVANANSASTTVNMPADDISLTANFEQDDGDTGDWPRDTQTQVVEVTNPTTGKTWMDRNLGASRAATSSTDAQAYGDLYQWGRAADGHQKRNSPTTSTLSSSDTPGHGNFITIGSSPYDWRSPQNTNLWQGVNGTNNPCPAGYRLPTDAELNAERVSWSSNNSAGAFASPLKLPVAGNRNGSSGSLNLVGSLGFYWSSTVAGTYSRYLLFYSSAAGMGSNARARGHSVRCLKDD